MSTDGAGPCGSALSDGLGVRGPLESMPRGEVMATGLVGGVKVELVRYTAEDIKNRDAQWKFELERERTVAREARCRMANLEMDLRRVLEGDEPICAFAVVDEVRSRLTPNVN